MNLHDLPKIELHCHLDGSLGFEMVKKQLADRGIFYPDAELRQKLIVRPDCTSLDEYLAGFALPLQCVQTAEGLEEAAYDLALREAAENVKYFETRFAPTSCQENGLTVGETIESVLKGLKRAEAEVGVFSGLIVCAMRHLPVEVNCAMAKEARSYLGSGLVCLDLAGGEAGHNNLEQAELFSYAASLDFPFIIHSGECGSAENVREAVELGAKRIGHGIAIAGHDDVKALCRDKHILLEMCPTSNLQTKAVNSMGDWPFAEFIRDNVPICINTDNRTVSDTTMTKELELVDRYFHPDEEMMTRMYTDAVEASFAPEDVKDYLLSCRKNRG